VRPTLRRLLVDNLLGFWDERIIDPKGGYRLAFDARGWRRRDRYRRAVTQARTTWFFSRLAQSSYGEPRHLEWAAHGYAYLRDRMWDPVEGGFFWEVDAAGPTVERKHVTAQAFGISALVEYSHAAGVEEGLELAEELFDLLVRRAHDSRFGGFGECRLRDWRPEPAGRIGLIGAPTEEKTMNAHMHLMTAFAALVDASSAKRPREHLRELVSILGDRAVNRSPTCYPDRHREDWTPAEGWRVSYGHDVEAVWLTMRAARALDAPDAELVPVWEALWDNTFEYGFDHERGGIYSGGPPGQPADQIEWIWWPQAEALVSALLMHRRTGDTRYERASLKILDWIARVQADWKRGDWYRVIAPDRRATGRKAGPWECPFHQGRMLLECLELLPAPRSDSS
jgi:mannobiose 2-epimerase